MRVGLALVMLCVVVSVIARAEDPLARLELNATEKADNNNCRMTFVIENKRAQALDTLKLDLALFDVEGVIKHRLIAEMGPVRGKRTNVRSFTTEGDCAGFGSILVNAVTVCAPVEAATCLDELELSSRVKTIKFYK